MNISTERFRSAYNASASFRMPAIVLLLIGLVSNVLTLTGSIFMLQVYDRVLASRSVPTLVVLTALMAVLYGFYALLEWTRMRMSARVASMVDRLLSQKMFEAAADRRPDAGTERNADPIRDLDTIRTFISGSGPLTVLDLPWLPVYLALVFVFHPMFGWLVTAGALVIMGLLVLNETQSRRTARQTAQAIVERQAHFHGTRNNLESVRAMGMMPPMAERWNKLAGRLGMLQRNSSDALAFYSTTTKSFRYFLQSAVLAMGAYLAIKGEITAGLMIAASIAAARALAPIEQLVGHWQGFVGFRQAVRRVQAVLAAPGQVSPYRTELPLPAQHLIVTNMATAPGLERAPLARGVSFSLQAGEALGIVGLSGSGKSSVARALVGVWPIIQGDVRLDGSELEHFQPDRLGAAIGYLPQAVELFDGTVAQNIARFSPGDTTSDMLRAARAAGVHDLIARLADGYDTRIGENGAMLSAGQRQRIGLARALFRDPFLIVLDEPNSNLDAEGDAALNEAVLSAKRRGAVVAIIAHRPSAIAMADKILFMQGGRQAAFGEKQDVLRRFSQNEPKERHDRIEGHFDTRAYAARG